MCGASRRPAEERPEIDKELAEQQKALSTLPGFKKNGVTNAILADKDSEIQSDLPLLNDAFQRAKSNPQLAIYKLQDAASKFAWLLIPISVPFLWLLFPFSRRFKLYDHSVFVTYSLSFMMLLAIVLTLCLEGRDPRCRAGGFPRPAVPHVPAAEGRLRPQPVERDLALGAAANLRGDRLLAVRRGSRPRSGSATRRRPGAGPPTAPAFGRLAFGIDEPAAGIDGPLVLPRSICSPARTLLISSPDRVSYSSSA